MISNFDVIEHFMEFEPGTFYKFECLIRNTDGVNNLYEQGYSNTNKNILVKSWYVDNYAYYEKIKSQMIRMCDLTGGRLYVTLDKKSNRKLVQELIHSLTDTLCDMVQGKEIGIKSLSKLFASKTSVVETSEKKYKTIMFDVDTKDSSIVEAVTRYIEYQPQTAHILITKKGYHIFCLRKFDHSNWLDFVAEETMNTEEYEASENQQQYLQEHKQKIKDVVSVKPNEIGLVYHPTADTL